jgi:DNA modification methylase
MQTTHKIHFSLAQQMQELSDSSVDLVVTSPPYPMIEMWDEIMNGQDNNIQGLIAQNKGAEAFELMHRELDKVWNEVNRVMKKGGFVCINIGDATRTLGENFNLFANHARIISHFVKMGFTNLPEIIWRKPTNSPNKFMGSGMLPAGAYVTLEHEFILIFRKGGKRVFKTDADKLKRQQSAFFWEERNVWFSDLWTLIGTNQKLKSTNSRERSAAYPFELAYRLINMYSVKSDIVLDPFLGTGTTSLAALASGRNSVGYEVDKNLSETISETLLDDKINVLNNLIKERLNTHLVFVQKRLATKEDFDFKHFNENYKFPVMTSQETQLMINFILNIQNTDNQIVVNYSEIPEMSFDYVKTSAKKTKQQELAF